MRKLRSSKAKPPNYREQCEALAAGTFDLSEMSVELADTLRAFLYFECPSEADGGLSATTEAGAFAALSEWLDAPDRAVGDP
jgi:hypothetical protein